MNLIYRIASRKEFRATELKEMHELRAKVFRERMRWEVPVIGGMEIDGYDAIDPFYMMMHGSDGCLRGCWRLLPTDGPYMLKDTFPELLHGSNAPEDPNIWELSRFAMQTESQPSFGFSNMAIESIQKIIGYGNRRGIRSYVTVTTTAIERMLRRADVVTNRIGPPITIGVERAVAIYVDIKNNL